ncbi:MAG: AAA domain-containing protein [Bacteroidales bacterium]|nr:AAA domain-containing protein [Bacteroidales bacterium]
MKTIQQINNELMKLMPLIEAERKAEIDEYAEKVNTQPLSEQRKMGFCRYPLRVSNQLFNRGEHLMIVLQQEGGPDDLPKNTGLFKSGQTIKLFQKDGDPEECATGVINNSDKDQLTVTLNTDCMKDWMLGRGLCAQLVFDPSTYREMEKAVSRMAETTDPDMIKLKLALYGGAAPEFVEDTPFISDTRLNASQNEALRLINSAQDVAVVHGPPGTGKTTTLVRAIIMTLRTEKRVLVCAPSNAAADLITEKLANLYINVVRIGQPARIDDVVLSNTLDYKIAAHPNYKDIKKMRRKADEYHRMAGKYKRNYTDKERREKQEYYREAKALSEEADNLAYYISNDIVSNAQVITCTLVGSTYREISDLMFRTVFIDEAAQALEPACLIPILKGARVVFAGDHCQLPPTVKTREAISGGLRNTLFEKVIARPGVSVMLSEQYRMNEMIMQFSNQQFYNSQLTANAACAKATIFGGDNAMEFIDLAGMGFSEKTEPKTMSTYNDEEAEILVQYLKSYLEIVEDQGKMHTISGIGIISPYKAQADTIARRMKKCGMPDYVRALTTIDTADSFQGREKDIIVISMTRCNQKGEIGFLNDHRRMNVAMTRAKRKLIIFGDSATISHSKFYEDFVKFCEYNNCYKSAFEIIEY